MSTEISDTAVAIAAQAMIDHPTLAGMIDSADHDLDSSYSDAAERAFDEIVQSRGRLADLELHGRTMLRLLRGVMKDMPPTDIRAAALEACNLFETALSAE